MVLKQFDIYIEKKSQSLSDTMNKNYFKISPRPNIKNCNYKASRKKHR